MNAGAYAALAAHAAHRAGGSRVAWLAAAAGFLTAIAAAGLPVADPADHALMAAGFGLAAAGAVAGIGLALGAALALTATPELAPIAAAPVARGPLALAALAGVAVAVAAAAAAGTAGALAGTALAASSRRPMERWAAPVALQGTPGPRAVYWAAGGGAPIRVRLLEDHPGGALTVRMRPRLRVSAGQTGPFTALPGNPIALSRSRPPGPLGPVPPEPLELAGNAWAKGHLTATFDAPAGPVELLVHAPHPGMRVGLGPDAVGVRLADAALGGVLIRAWAGLVAPLVLIVLVSAATSAICSRGVAAAAGLATALSLGLAPIARASLAEFHKPEGVVALLEPLVAGLLALIPASAGGIEALLGGQDLAWAVVGGRVAAHLPWAAVLAAGAWWAVRKRDW